MCIVLLQMLHVHIAIKSLKVLKLMRCSCFQTVFTVNVRELIQILQLREWLVLFRSILKGCIDVPICKNRMNSNAKLASQQLLLPSDTQCLSRKLDYFDQPPQLSNVSSLLCFLNDTSRKQDCFKFHLNVCDFLQFHICSIDNGCKIGSDEKVPCFLCA